MSCHHLNNQLEQILKDGFKNEFVFECAEKFENTEFSLQAKTFARLYLFYLSRVMKAAISENELWKKVTFQVESFVSTDDIQMIARKLIADSGLEAEPENVALAIGACCYSYIMQNKKSGEDFLTLFVNSWFGFYSSR